VDWKGLKEAVSVLVRSLNWITLLNETGVEKIDVNTQRERRIGLGTIGIHEMLIRMSMRSDKEYIYSQDSGRGIAKKVLKFIKHAAYEASIDMAKEIGPFPAYDFKKFKQSKFIQQLLKERPDLEKELKAHGIANVTVLTQAPTGTTGTITGYSSGCEPYFAMAYQRNSNIGTIMDGCPSFIEWMEGRGIDFAEYNFDFRELRKHKRVPKYFEQAQDIGWRDHLAMQAVFSEQVDSSVSKTINLPSEATVDDIMGAYIGAFDMNIKSTAVYRDGSKTQILETLKNPSKSTGARPQTVVPMKAPLRPDELDCDIHTISVKGEKWKVLVGLLHGKPYEVFCFPEEHIEISPSRQTGVLKRNGHGRYNLLIGTGEDTWTIKNVAHFLLNDEHRMITRLLSTSLRHGAPLNALVSQLTKCDGEVTAFSKAILRVLKKYITDEEYLEVLSCRSCQSKRLVMESGCVKCADCGVSGCE
jgi:ribonucleoside-diphosphate reductase alpha chain